MAKHYTKDMLTGRITETASTQVVPNNGRTEARWAQVERVNRRAESLAIAAGFSRTEYRNARKSTQTIWRNRALEALISDGTSFDPFVIEYIR